MRLPGTVCAITSLTAWIAAAAPALAAEPQPGSPERAAILAALRPLVEADLGAPIAFRVSRIDIEGGWAYVSAVPTRGPNPLDWSKTKYADSFAKDMMSNLVLGLFHLGGGTWHPVEYALGPTDVAWEDWIGKHRVPRALFVPATAAEERDPDRAPIEGLAGAAPDLPQTAEAPPMPNAPPSSEPPAADTAADLEKALDAALAKPNIPANPPGPLPPPNPTAVQPVPSPPTPPVSPPVADLAPSNPPVRTDPILPTIQSPAPPADPLAEQRARWAEVANSRDPNVLARFLNDFPTGPFAADAANNLGALLTDGPGVAHDPATAARLFQFAADLGNAHAANNLGNMYATGNGVAKDDTRAAQLYRRGADLGNPDAMTNFGIMLASGRGVPRNDVAAAELYRRAGNVNGMMLLAGMVDAGRGVARDPAEAARLYLESLRLGQPSARDILVGQRGKALTVATRRAIQTRLIEAGAYTGAVDGVFRPAVLRALEAWRG